MRGAIFVAAQAHLTFQPRHVAMPGMTALAGLMLGFVVQTGQRRRGMTAAARGRLRDTVGPVGTVTTQAALAQLAVR